jgi:Na+-translocating ferredoxin:NAD+ oxidoreductase RNF subunit RnfB
MNRDSTSDITYKWDEGISYDGVAKLSDDRREAMRKMREIEEISSRLPQIDCGSCGAPTCRALAEDIVKGKAKMEDCVIVMRNKLVEFLHNHSEINPDELGLKDILEHTSDKSDNSDKKE